MACNFGFPLVAAAQLDDCADIAMEWLAKDHALKKRRGGSCQADYWRNQWELHKAMLVRIESRHGHLFMPNILLIEDEPEMCRSVQRILGRSGEFNVSVAFDGPSGLAAARAAMPDLVLLDILMPGMDGIEVLRTMKRDDRTCSIPVVMMTAVNDQATMATAISQCAEHYLTKPVPPDELCRIVRELTRVRSPRRLQEEKAAV